METFKLYDQEDREVAQVIAAHRQRLRQEQADRVRNQVENRRAEKPEEQMVDAVDFLDTVYEDAVENEADPSAWFGKLVLAGGMIACYLLGAAKGLIEPIFAGLLSAPWGIWAIWMWIRRK